MNTLPRPSLLKTISALLLVVSLVAASCGSSVGDQVAGQTSVSAIPLPTPATGTSTNNPQHGLTLEEWGETMAGPELGESLGSDSTDGDVPSADFTSITWEDLIPVGQSGEEIFARFKDRLDTVEYGSNEADLLYERMDAEFDRSAINPDLNGQLIRLAGFVAPLTFDDDIVTEFLLVPTFGACIHVPPPPPNQTVLVTIDRSEGLTPDESWGAVWVEGTLTADTADTDLATASYTLSGTTSGVFTDF